MMNKDFDFLMIIKSFENKRDALIAENAIIRFVSIENNHNNINSKFVDLICFKESKSINLLKESEVVDG